MHGGELKPLGARHGYFEGYDVRGVPYVSNSGDRRGWHVTATPQGNNRFERYWVTVNGEFHTCTMDLHSYIIGISETSVEVEPAVKIAINSALAKWNLH